MSRDHHPPLRDVTADTEKTASSNVACWTAFTGLLLGNAFTKSVKIFSNSSNNFKTNKVQLFQGLEYTTLDTSAFSTNYNLSIYFTNYPPHQKHVIILVGSGNVTIIIIIILSGERLSPLGTAATNWPIVPAPDDR
jgi:hypothetical protein